jgi:hypothetical protein
MRFTSACHWVRPIRRCSCCIGYKDLLPAVPMSIPVPASGRALGGKNVEWLEKVTDEQYAEKRPR